MSEDIESIAIHPTVENSGYSHKKSYKRALKDKKYKKIIAKRRINRLFELAEQNALSNRLHLSDRYIELARKISMRYLIPIPKEYKRRFCKHCYSYLLPHVTGRIRINRGKLTIYCYNCKKFTRILLKKPTD